MHSARELLDCRVLARDGGCSYVADLLLDDEWRVPAMIVAMRAWLEDQAVLVFPDMVEEIDYAERALRIRVA